MYKVMTIDVWDTLLRRDCHPECIKLATARHLFLEWSSQLKPEFTTPLRLYDARLDVEQMLANQTKSTGKDNEYIITRVLEEWLTNIFSNQVPPNLSERLAQFELNVEISRSSPDPSISLFLQSYAAETTLFLSDFYMDSGMLLKILSAKGLDTLVDGGISSCDVGLNKRSGRLFQHIHSLYGVSPNQHLHIGDNEWSDVSSPQALGINAVHYLPKQEHARRLLNEHLFSSRDALFDHVRTELLSSIHGRDRNLSPKQAAAFNLGAQAAPLFFGFTLWVAEQAVLKKLDKLYFFTREGEFFHEVFRTLFPNHLAFGHKLPPTDILAVSRLSTFAASMREPSIQEMSRIWSLFREQSISGLFTTLGLNISDFLETLDKLGIKQSDVISNPENSLELRRLFETPAFTNSLKETLAHQTDILRNYLKQSGIEAGERVGIVDIGWRGTIQDNIALLLPNTHFHGMYLGLRKFINAQPLNTSKSAYGPDQNISNESSSLFANFSAMEMLCNSPHGSVIGYICEGGRSIPERQHNRDENLAHDQFVAPFQKGVVAATEHWREYLERYAVSSHELREIALHAWKSLQRMPSEELVNIYLHTPQHDLFGYGEIFKRNRYPSLTTIVLSPFVASKRKSLTSFVRRVQWSEAIKNSKDIGPIHRFLLLRVFQAASIIKHIRSNKRLPTNSSRP